uniref:LIM domain containing preferred translocation partner in lipoma n=1 Tax=Podarcis muralis TaxID=64176 RepID=A0A670KJU6_PODMU
MLFLTRINGLLLLSLFPHAGLWDSGRISHRYASDGHPSHWPQAHGHPKPASPDGHQESASKPGSQPIPVTPVGTLKPQPVPASYSTASTPNRPTFNVQVKSAQPAPHFQPPAPSIAVWPPNQAAQPASSLGPAPYVPSQPRAADYGYVPQTAPHPEPSYGYGGPQGRYQEPAYPGGYGGRTGSDPSYVPQNAWKQEATYPSPGSAALNPTGQYPSSGAKKTYITEPATGPQPPLLQPKVRGSVRPWRWVWETGKGMGLDSHRQVELVIAFLYSHISCYVRFMLRSFRLCPACYFRVLPLAHVQTRKMTPRACAEAANCNLRMHKRAGAGCLLRASYTNNSILILICKCAAASCPNCSFLFKREGSPTYKSKHAYTKY